MTEKQRCLSTHETAEYLGMKYLTVVRLVKRGEIPAVKIGRRWRVPIESLERMISPKKENKEAVNATKN